MRQYSRAFQKPKQSSATPVEAQFLQTRPFSPPSTFAPSPELTEEPPLARKTYPDFLGKVAFSDVPEPISPPSFLTGEGLIPSGLATPIQRQTYPTSNPLDTGINPPQQVVQRDVPQLISRPPFLTGKDLIPPDSSLTVQRQTYPTSTPLAISVVPQGQVIQRITQDSGEGEYVAMDHWGHRTLVTEGASVKTDSMSSCVTLALWCDETGDVVLAHFGSNSTSKIKSEDIEEDVTDGISQIEKVVDSDKKWQGWIFTGISETNKAYSISKIRINALSSKFGSYAKLVGPHSGVTLTRKGQQIVAEGMPPVANSENEAPSKTTKNEWGLDSKGSKNRSGSFGSSTTNKKRSGSFGSSTKNNLNF